MMKSARTTLPVLLSSAVGLSAVTLMFVAPGEAAPTPSTFSATVEGDVWRVNRLDLDMSGDPQLVDVAVANAQAELGSAAAPDRAWAAAQNVLAQPKPAGHAVAASTATATQDTSSTTTGSGQAGSVPSVIDFGPSALTARGRWGGDTTCLDAALALTSSRAISESSGIVPAAIPEGTAPTFPIPLPTEIPTEVPTELPSDFPTELPTDLPTILPTTGLPTLPTELPTTGLPTLPVPTLPTEIPTTLLPTVPLPGLPRAEGAAAEGDVAMAEVAAASVEEKTFLQSSTGDFRRVYGEVLGKAVTPAQPLMTFFGGEAQLLVAGQAKLSAYSSGGANGSQVTWEPPAMKLVVGGEEYDVPSDGTALALPYSKNEDVVLTVSAGKLTSAESPTGELAQATVSALNVIIKNGDNVALDAELFPMELKVVSPQGGVDCTPVAAPERVTSGLKLKGKSNGKKADKITANAISKASGAKATLFKVVKGKNKKVAGGKLNAKGDRAFKVKDKNGKKPTKYVVKISRTDLTKPGKASKKLR